LAVYAAQELQRHLKEFFAGLVSLLDSYGGPGSQAEARSFSWVKSKVLRQIVERDYRELTLVLHPSGAWKSAVVMAGSILEAVLYDLLTRGPSRVKRAMAAANAPPKSKGGPARNIRKNTGNDRWDLADLIAVAVELKLLPSDREKTIDQVLRDYRNFVHPHKEVRADHACSEGEALAAIGALMCVCDHLEKAPSR
jgi:hypothetical protein